MKCVLFAGIIASIFVFGEALNCYYSYEIDMPFNANSQSIKCLKESDRCAKISSGLINGTAFVFRSCAENTSLIFEGMSPFVLNKTISYMGVNFCDTDNCNSAQSIIAIFSTIFTSLFVSIFASY